MTTDFEELFDDVMFYAKKKLGGKDFATKEDLEDYIRDSDPQRKIKQWVRKEILDTSAADRAITAPPEIPDKVKEKIVQKAVDAELKRKKRARAADEAITAKTVKPITDENFKRWLKSPGRFDLRGVDTKSHQLIKNEINQRIRDARAKGFKVGMKRNEPYRKEKGESRRSLITGRFIGRK